MQEVGNGLACLASVAGRFPPPEQEPLHLAARGLRQFADELDLARVGVEPEALAHVLLQLGLERVGSDPAGA